MEYLIKKGWHYCFPPHAKLHCGIKSLSAQVKFSPECYYPLVDTNDYDINKLIGWSYGYHHNNSIRVGWRPSKTLNTIELFFYTYNNRKRFFTSFTNVKTDLWYKITIDVSCDYNKIYFTLKEYGNTTKAFIPFKCPKFKWGYFLYPYFGGDKTAPHDMKIFLSYLEIVKI